MATKKTKEEDEGQEKEEPRIPVFTVVKNGAILKNIFIVNTNTNTDSDSTICRSSKLKEQILIIGRHPDCNVILTHPSISRFHLKIISNPSSQTLSVIDLSSVHGTWVSEKKIEPWVRVEVNEGDSLRIGGSSRVYRLHWIPLSRAHYFETPCVAASEELMDEDKEDYSSFEAFQDENSVPVENNRYEEEERAMTLETEEAKDDSSLFADLVGEGSDENLEMRGKKEIPSAPPITDNLIFSLFDENEESTESPLKVVGKENEVSGCCDEAHLVTELEKLLLDIDGVSSENEESAENPLKDVGEERELSSYCHKERLVSIAEKLSLANHGIILENEEDPENLSKDVGQEKEVSRFCDEETWVTELEKFYMDNDGVRSENEDSTESSLKDVGQEKEVLRFCDEETLALELENCLSIDGLNFETEGSSRSPSKGVGRETEVLSFCDEETLATESEKLSLAIDLVGSEIEGGAGNLSKDVGPEKEVSSFCDEETLATKLEKVSLAIDGVGSEMEEGAENPLKDIGQEKQVSSFYDEETLATESEKLCLSPDEDSLKNEERNVISSKNVGREKEVLRFCDNDTLATEFEKLCLAFDGISSENEETTWSPLKDAGQEKEVPSFCCEETFVTELEKLPLAVDGISSENEKSTESRLKDAGQEKDIPSFCHEKTFVTELEKLPFDGAGVSSEDELLVYDINSRSSETSFVTETGCENESPEISPRERENDSPLQGNIFNLDRSLESSLVTEFLCERASPEIPSGELENLSSFKHGIFPEAVYDLKSPSETAKRENSSVDSKPNLLADSKSAYSDEEVYLASKTLEETEELKPSTKDSEPRNGSVPESVNVPLPNEDIVQGSEKRSIKKTSSGSVWSRRGKPASSLQLQMGQSRVETTLDGADSEDTRPDYGSIFSGVNGIEDEIFTPDKENFPLNSFLAKSQKKVDKLVASDTTSTDGQEEDEVFTPDKENFTPDTFLVKSLKRKGKLASSQYRKEDEVSTPDSENFSPNNFPLKSSKNKGVLSEVKYSKASRSSPLKIATCGPTKHLGEDSAESLRNENHMSRVLQELKPVKKSTSGKKVSLERELLFNRKRLERIPFQSLLEESDGKSGSSPARNSSSASNTRTEGKTIINPVSNNLFQQSNRKPWTMVADTSTLLNKRSRKYLQLLQRLKQTRLVIPQMVIRELDGMKQRGSLFGRKTEACLILEWIEQCLVETSTWIHVQSSAEDSRLTAPTPPASPWIPSLGSWSSMEICSPKTQDHILECALMCRKMNTDRQVVLLSDNVDLKAKALAEGMLCEGVQEFRGSLVNPFSERFLWVESSPRGQTWTFADEVVLREKYSRCPLKRQEVSAKGLKLILLHNSHYGQRTPVGYR